MAYQIREATVTDLPWLRRLYAAHVAELAITYPRYDEEELDALVCTLYALMCNRLGHEGAVIIVTVGHSVVGMVLVEIVQRPVGKPRQFGSADMLYVVPRHRGKGLGTLLLDAAFTWFSKHGISTGEITAMPALGPFWEARGFRPQVTRYYTTSDTFTARAETRPLRRAGAGHER